MLQEFTATERLLSALTIVPAVYFASIGLGRFMKRRLGVRLGVMFQLFSIALAAYVSLALCYSDVPGILREIRRGVPRRGDSAGIVLRPGAFPAFSLMEAKRQQYTASFLAKFSSYFGL